MNVMQTASQYPTSPWTTPLCIPLDDPILSPSRLSTIVHDILIGKQFEDCSLDECITHKAQIIFRAKALPSHPASPTSSTKVTDENFQVARDEDSQDSSSSSGSSIFSALESTASSDGSSSHSCSSQCYNGLDEPGFVAVIKNHPHIRQHLSSFHAKSPKEQRKEEARNEKEKARYLERGFRDNRWKCCGGKAVRTTPLRCNRINGPDVKRCPKPSCGHRECGDDYGCETIPAGSSQLTPAVL